MKEGREREKIGEEREESNKEELALGGQMGERKGGDGILSNFDI